jgi:putative endonuclease
LIYFERYQVIQDAIAREKQLKGWVRRKKIELIEAENPRWRFLNEDIMEWPPNIIKE